MVGGKQSVIINASEFNSDIIKDAGLSPCHRGNPRTRRRRTYKNILAAFDIETSYVPAIEQNIMYIWQLQLNEVTVIGRTWYEYMNVMQSIADALNDTWIVVWVHNLSYEFQFLRGLYNLAPEDVFVIKSRRVLKMDVLGCIEFRCSYLHSNMSLKEYLSKMGAEHQKLSGDEFNYNVTRYPWTPLTEREIEYCVNDVRGLVEALEIEMEIDGDTLYTVPLTSTGYVRRDAKRALREFPHNQFIQLFPSFTTYEMLREAFRGGNTHANRCVVGVKIPDVKSFDRSSSYPDVQINRLYPMTPFRNLKTVSYKELMNTYIKKKGFAIVARVSFDNIYLKDKFFPCPYIPRDKCRHIKNGLFDNGRILEADHIEITVTDVDLKIIEGEYTFSKAEVINAQFSRYGQLPESLREVTINYYRKKTILKGQPGQEVYYTKEKNKLNSVYGMSAQDPAKERILYNPKVDGLFEIEDFETDERIRKRKILAESKPVMPYQWGVWVTAWARYELERGLMEIQKQGACFIYADTDSLKFYGDVDFTRLNDDLKTRSEENGAWADDARGERHYMGVYESEGTYRYFETMGAKSYVYEDNEGELHITIAGVPKKNGAAELKRAGGFEAYKDGFCFTDGVQETVYNDLERPKEIELEGNKVLLTSNIVIKQSHHIIGQTEEYRELVRDVKQMLIEEYDETVYNKIGVIIDGKGV